MLGEWLLWKHLPMCLDAHISECFKHIISHREESSPLYFLVFNCSTLRNELIVHNVLSFKTLGSDGNILMKDCHLLWGSYRKHQDS